MPMHIHMHPLIKSHLRPDGINLSGGGGGGGLKVVSGRPVPHAYIHDLNFDQFSLALSCHVCKKSGKIRGIYAKSLFILGNNHRAMRANN